MLCLSALFRDSVFILFYFNLLSVAWATKPKRIKKKPTENKNWTEKWTGSECNNICTKLGSDGQNRTFDGVCVFCGNLFAIQRNRNFKQMNSFHWLTHRTKRRFQQINSRYWTRLSVHHIHIFTNTFYKYYIWIGSQHEFSLSLSLSQKKKLRFKQMEIQKHQQNHKTTKQKWNNF